MLKHEGLPAALVIDSPGLSVDPKQREALVEKAADSDLVLWVVAASRADREIDRVALDALRAHFAARLNRRRRRSSSPQLIDRLRPFGEWAPPYDLATDYPREGAQHRGGRHRGCKGPRLRYRRSRPREPRRGATPYNVERLWQRIAEKRFPKPKRAQLCAASTTYAIAWSWKRIWSQATGARTPSRLPVR